MKLKEYFILFLFSLLFIGPCTLSECYVRNDDYLDNMKNDEALIFDSPSLQVSARYCYYRREYAVSGTDSHEQDNYTGNWKFKNKTDNSDVFIKKIEIKYISDNFEIPYKRFLVYNDNLRAIPFDNFNDIEPIYKTIHPYKASTKSYTYNYESYRENVRIFSFIFQDDMRAYKNIVIDVYIEVVVNNEVVIISRKIPVSLSRGYKPIPGD